MVLRIIRYPLIPEMTSESVIGFPNWELLKCNCELVCYLLYFITKSSLASFYAVLSIIQSIIITNKALSAISPVFTYVIISKLIGSLGFPSFLDPLVIFNNNLKLYLNFGGNVEEKVFSPLAALYPFFYSCVFLVVACFFVSLLLKEKINNRL